MRVTERLRVVDADTLLSTPLEKTAFVVDGLIPMGVTLLGGSSKIGKSWLMLWLGLQAARGEIRSGAWPPTAATCSTSAWKTPWAAFRTGSTA